MADYPVRVTGTIGPTPQNPITGAMARGLRSLQQLASQYQVLPQVPLLGGTSVDELLSLPGAASLMEDISYQGPRALIKGGNLATGGIGTFRLDPRVLDAADVATLAVPAATLATKGAVQGTKALGRLAAEGIERAVQSRNPLVAAVQPAYVVKPRGGNWAQRDVEATMIDPLKREQTPILSGELVNEAAGRDLFSEYRKVYDQDPTVGLHDWMRANYPDIYAGMHEPNALAINKWLDTKLTRYIKNEMGTPEDSVRALAERGVLHFQPRDATGRARAHRAVAQSVTENASPPIDFRPRIMGESPLARGWEDVADSAILPGTYRDFVSEYVEPERLQNALRGVGGEYAVNNPDAAAYTLNRGRGAPDVGFDHLVDELKTAMAPDSLLPANLRLTPEQLEKVTVPQAVELVDKINKWRSAEAAKAEKLGMMQNLKATPRAVDEGLQLSFVEKPGAVWVDIPETVSEKGMKLCTTIGKQGGWCTQSEDLARAYGSGENRLVAMLDADGRPHVQAKITRDVDQMSAFDAAVESFTPAQEAAWGRHFDALEGSPGLGDALEWMKDNAPDAYKNYLQILQSQPNVKPPDITELKPVANSFRSDRAQEYGQRDPNYFRQIENAVLKFLNEGQWGRVADLDHYGIVRIAPDSDLGARLQAAGVQYPEFVSQRQLSELLDKHGRTDLPPYAQTGDPEGFAQGGLVELEQKYNTPGYQAGGLVKVFKGLANTLAAKEAPAVVVPGKLARVQEAARQSKGDYGAKRVQRAADEVKNLDKMYQEEGLLRVFTGDNAKAVVTGRPSEFQDFAARLKEPYRPAVEEYLRKMSGAGGGAEDLPYLEIGKPEFFSLLKVAGHEGRHRNIALDELGEDKTLWTLYPRLSLREALPRRSQEEYIEALRKELGESRLVLPERRADSPESSPAQLPEPYAAGGLVELEQKYAGGGAVKTGLVKVFKELKTMLAGEAPTAAREAAEIAETAAAAPVREQKMLQGFYRGYSGENTPAKTALGNPTYFVSPQKRVADYYATRRAAETGGEPHAEMVLADPFGSRNQPYGLSIPIDEYNRDFLVTRARRVDPDEVKSRTPLYAEGGAVEFDPDKIDRMAADILSQQPVEVGDKPVIFKNPDELLARQERLQAGPLSLGVVRSPRGADARLGLAVAPELEPFADVDPIRRKLTQYGVQYNQPLEDGDINAQFAVDPKSGAKMLAGAYRKQIGKDSELSARGAYVTGAGKPSYNVGVQYRKRFAAGGAVEFDSDKIEAMAAQLSEELYA